MEAAAETSQEGSPARQHDALFHDLRGELGGDVIQGLGDGPHDGVHRLVQGLAESLVGEGELLGHPPDDVPAPDLDLEALLKRAGRPGGDLDPLGLEDADLHVVPVP